MKILHYFLGFPPYRTGGLTKFAYDLAKTQANDGNDVLALWPGKIENYLSNPKIKKRKMKDGIKSVELINPLPISLDEGIKNFKEYTAPCDINIYIDWLNEIKPDVIHMHTLMGIHKEFVLAANKLKVRTIFTSHDYFGLCPKVNFYRYGTCCDDDNGCENCIQCNLKSLSLNKIKIMQSPIYRTMKNTWIVKSLRKKHRYKFYNEEIIPKMPILNIENLANEYIKLRAYYIEMFESIDFIHFNSAQTEKIFKKFVTPQNSKVITITHMDIKDNHDNGHINSDKLRIYYLAPPKPFKGWNVLKEACDQLWSEGVKNMELIIYGTIKNKSEYMIVHEGGYDYKELPEMMKNADVVIVPSVCYETFGFTVIEALSYGVPVIVSNHVGAKDIVGESGIVFPSSDVMSLKKAILNIKDINNISIVKKWEILREEIYNCYSGELN